jgi:hypothetical protein
MSLQVEFGTGTLFGIPASGTPVPFGITQDVSVDISFTTKELYGQNQFPVAIGRGEAKIQCKAKTAQFSSLAFNGLFSNTTPATGGTVIAVSEAHTVPSTGPYTITITPPGGGTFVEDLGVSYQVSGQFFQKVTPTVAGEYTQAAAVYTFGVADASALVYISYEYTVTTGVFATSVNNQPMGSATTFIAVLSNSYNGNVFTLKLYACLSSKLSMDFKNTDFSVPEMDFSAFANAGGQVYQLTITSL